MKNLWQESLSTLDDKEGSVLHIKNLEIEDFKGKRNASTTAATTITILNSESDSEATALISWWSTQDHAEVYENLNVPALPLPNE